ncbi:tol-pal system protein YbgF [Methylococcaceae bacterium WWC4]|nr:tol-pal system protein YbgF [Methylococcaceae bacterium WWC4]
MSRRALLIASIGLGLGAQAQAAPANGGDVGQQGGYAVQAPTDNAIFEVLSRLEQLQSEVQQLRGMVEEQSQTIADLQRKQSNMYSDLDDRMQALQAAGQPGGAPAVAAAQAGAASTAAASAVPPAQTGATPPSVAGSPVSTPASQAAPAPVAAAVPPAEVKPAINGAASAGPRPATSGSEQERYQQAYETLRNGHNSQAIKMFQELLAANPAGEFSDNAQYWLAEAYKINREFDAAKAAFNKVVSQYPNSSKVPDALLKLGYIEFDLQNAAKAKDYLTRVTTSYPGTTAAHLAAKKLAQMPQ